MRPPSPSRRAFTLVETLVSIALLAILALLILFGSQRIKNQVGLTRCLSNLRQVHAALLLYVQDHNGTLPGPLTSTMTPYFRVSGAGQVTQNQLSGHLAPYLDVPLPEPGQGAFNHHLACPAYLATLGAGERTDSQIKRSYGIPLGASGYPFGYSTSSDPSKTRQPQNIYAHMTEYNPSSTWILRDIDRESNPSDTTVIPAPAHASGRNYLYMDGSVRFLKDH